MSKPTLTVNGRLISAEAIARRILEKYPDIRDEEGYLKFSDYIFDTVQGCDYEERVNAITGWLYNTLEGAQEAKNMNDDRGRWVNAVAFMAAYDLWPTR